MPNMMGKISGIRNQNAGGHLVNATRPPMFGGGGRTRPAVKRRRARRARPVMARGGRTRPAVRRNKRARPVMARGGRTRPIMARGGRTRPIMARGGRTRPAVRRRKLRR